MPVFGTISSKFNDDGVTALYHALLDTIAAKTGIQFEAHLDRPQSKISTSKTIIIPPERTRYLSEIADSIRSYHKRSLEQSDALRSIWHLKETAKTLSGDQMSGDTTDLLSRLKNEIKDSEAALDPETHRLVDEWEELKQIYNKDELVYHVREQEIRGPLFWESLSHSRIPKIALPQFKDPGETYRWLREENVPGRFPFTAGVFPLKRVGEDPTRMFAGEGDPARTNRRFKM
jgi:methylmalonyl-CoA mutase